MKKLDSLNRILDDLEEHLDEEHCERVEQRHLEALAFQKMDRLPLSIYCKPEGELLSNVEAFYNPEVMLQNELLKSETFGNVVNSVRIRDDYPLHIRANHGLAVTHSIYGGKYVLNEGATPWAQSEPSLQEFRKRWEDRPFEVKENPEVKLVLETYQYYAERLAEYPKCSRRIKLSHPDMQGTLQSAQSLFGADFFYELYDHPEDVHWLLRHICEAYVEYFRLLDPLMNNYVEAADAQYIHGALYPGKILLKNDTATAMLSREHYLEFCRPYDEWIAGQLGTSSIHYCGSSQPFHYEVLGITGLRGINFGDPQRQDVDGFVEHWSGKQVAAVCWGYHQPPEFLYRTLHGREVRGFTLCCTVDDINQAAEYVKRYGEQGLESFK